MTYRKIPDEVSTNVRKVLAQRLEERLDEYEDLDELARRLKVHRTLLDHWRKGRRAPTRDLDKLVQLADALGVSIDYLFGRPGAIPPPPLRMPIDVEALDEAIEHSQALTAALERIQKK